MPFDQRALLEAMESSFAQGGADDFKSFLAAHLPVRRWIVASDFNIGSPGAPHDVFAFTVYPVDPSINDLSDKLKTVFAADFKKTRALGDAQRRFVAAKSCFSFAFLVPPARHMLRTSDHANDLRAVRELLDASLAEATERGGSVCLNSGSRRDRWNPAGFRPPRIAAAG